MLKITKLKILFLLPIFYFLFIYSAKAAELNLISQTQAIGIGRQFQADLVLDTEGQNINAVEGKIIFPAGLLEIKEIRDGNSIINFWMEKPKNTSEGQIAFSGIIPGGYNDSRGLIFSITFLAKKEGGGAIEFNGVKALLNDGKGTFADVKISNFHFLISNQIPISQILKPAIKDIEPPETFRPEVAIDESLFDGKYFLAFATQDKGSGIDYYEVKEGGGSFIIAESPYLLKDQDLKSFIYVKAIDKSGNERLAAVEPRYPISWYELWWIWIIIITSASIIYFIRKRIWKK